MNLDTEVGLPYSGRPLSPQGHIELYEDTARVYFRDVLGMNYDRCLVTAETHLSDLSSCGLPDDFPEQEGGLKELYAAWDNWALAERREATSAAPSGRAPEPGWSTAT